MSFSEKEIVAGKPAHICKARNFSSSAVKLGARAQQWTYIGWLMMVMMMKRRISSNNKNKRRQITLQKESRKVEGNEMKGKTWTSYLHQIRKNITVESCQELKVEALNMYGWRLLQRHHPRS